MYRRYEALHLQRLLTASEVAVAIRKGLASEKDHVRLPRRAAAFPMLVNVGRRLSNVVQRGIGDGGTAQARLDGP